MKKFPKVKIKINIKIDWKENNWFYFGIFIGGNYILWPVTTIYSFV